MNYGWRFVTIPMEKKCKKAKWLSGEALQIAVNRREVKSKGKKERYKHLNAEMEPKQKHHPFVDVTADGSKVRCYKEQYCIGTWNVRSVNQGKLEVVKQKMARVRIDILGISKLRWTGMDEFNSDDHYIYFCGQEFLRRNGV